MKDKTMDLSLNITDNNDQVNNIRIMLSKKPTGVNLIYSI